MKFDIHAVVAGLWAITFGLLFLLDINGALDLRPAVLWPLLLISWGVNVVAGVLPRAPRPDSHG